MYFKSSRPWTWDEEKKFAHILEIFPDDESPNRWKRIADLLQRSPGEVEEHYEAFYNFDTVNLSGRVDVTDNWEDRPMLFCPLMPEIQNSPRVGLYYLDDWSTTEITDHLHSPPGEVREQHYEALVHNDIVITDQLQSPPGEVREHDASLVHNDIEIESGRGDALVYKDDAAAGWDSAGQKSFGSKHVESKGKRGTPWTEEEHKLFLSGLQTYRKGDWRSIARNKVKTKTPTQVASHAQKYFLRQNSMKKERKRSSIHDITVFGSNMERPAQHESPAQPQQQIMSEFDPTLDQLVDVFNSPEYVELVRTPEDFGFCLSG